MQLISEFKPLVKLAWPLLIAQLTQMLMSVSDTIMAGRVSPTDMAGVAIAASIFLPITIFIQGVIMAVPPIISRLDGGKLHKKIPEAGQQAFWLALMISIPVACANGLTYDLLGLIDMEIPLRNVAAEYLQYVLVCVPAFALYQVFRQYCEGMSITKPSMIIMGIGLLINIPANYVFIYGELGVPAYGGAGCGIASALVFVIMMISTWLYVRFADKLRHVCFFSSMYKPRWEGIKEILHLGIPIALALLFEVTLFSVVAILLSPLGPKVVAAHQIALNFSGLLFMIPLSIGFATTIRIGNLLGDGQPLRAQHAAHSAILLGLILATFNATVSIVFKTQIAQLYTEEKMVIEMAADLLMLAAVFQFSDAAQVISGCALRGYKDTKAMFYITLTTYWGVGLTSGYLLALTDIIIPALGAAGFWIGFIVGLTSAGILLTARMLIIQKRHFQLQPA
ncbi:MAG: MATE family efflux transporter [Aestuariibacter sp.]